MLETPQKTKKRRWATFSFGPELLPLEPFDLQPIADIPIRLAVEEGAIKRNKELALYKTKEDWNVFPKGSIVIAGLIEKGKTFAVWIGNSKNVPLEAIAGTGCALIAEENENSERSVKNSPQCAIPGQTMKQRLRGVIPAAPMKIHVKLRKPSLKNWPKRKIGTHWRPGIKTFFIRGKKHIY
ncbi:MAG: hypothetical protein AB1656_05840 [Candidatus Omnitrophota bacterium]